jgi:hypothetical protein
MSSVQAITEDIKFEAKIASFYEFSNEAQKDLLEALSKAVYETGKKHDFLTWRVQLITDSKK